MKRYNKKISLARLYYPVTVLGPGRRVGIWLNGCDRCCTGCVSPNLRIYDKSKEVTINEIGKMLNVINAPIDGFTISGGEPFYNPESLSELIEMLIGISDDILIFTGYTLEELKDRNDESINRVLMLCSALIDGPYIKVLNNNIGLRGSSNQRCWVFRHHDKYADIEVLERHYQSIMYGNTLLTIGIPKGDQEL